MLPAHTTWQKKPRKLKMQKLGKAWVVPKAKTTAAAKKLRQLPLQLKPKLQTLLQMIAKSNTSYQKNPAL